MRRGAVRGLTVLSCPCLSVGFFQKAISLVQPTHLYSRSLFISSRPQCLLCALFSVSPCLACPQRPLHVVTLCEHRCATHVKSTGSSAIISSPVRSDSVRLPLPSRLVRRTSRLGDKIKIPIDFLRPFSNTPGSVCFPTLSFPLRSAHELPVIVFTLYDIRKACRIIRMPEDGVRLSPAGFRFRRSISIPMSRGCPLHSILHVGGKLMSPQNPFCYCTIQRGGHLPQSSFHVPTSTRSPGWVFTR